MESRAVLGALSCPEQCRGSAFGVFSHVFRPCASSKAPCLPPHPRQPRDGSVGRCQRLFPAARPAQCTGRPGLALRRGQPQCISPCVNAIPRRHSDLPLPHPCHSGPVHTQVGGGEGGGGLQPCRAPTAPAQLVPWEAAPVSKGHASSCRRGGAELPEPCQGRLPLWETTSEPSRNSASLQTSPGAAGIALQRLLLQVIYCQVWGVRATPPLEVVFFFCLVNYSN